MTSCGNAVTDHTDEHWSNRRDIGTTDSISDLRTESGIPPTPREERQRTATEAVTGLGRSLAVGPLAPKVHHQPGDALPYNAFAAPPGVGPTNHIAASLKSRLGWPPTHIPPPRFPCRTATKSKSTREALLAHPVRRNSGYSGDASHATSRPPMHRCAPLAHPMSPKARPATGQRMKNQ